ncbi:hypothetical protein ABZ234_25705, partial [Nocardiopsis sp. NPDC006198]|uniref:hypothetical protein n=1 Tax=Nocardiopsis sp. NPDC006198 TaxID=3154472 RepID=UPI0033A6BE89
PSGDGRPGFGRPGAAGAVGGGPTAASPARAGEAVAAAPAGVREGSATGRRRRGGARFRYRSMPVSTRTRS